MLFNSPIFLLAFLPVALAGYYVLGRMNDLWARIWLVLASLFFYSWTVPQYLPLLLGSVFGNYYLSRAIEVQEDRRRAKLLLVVAISFNLLLIGYFKYANFFIDTTERLSGLNFGLVHVVLPLAISFFTFQQIAYQVNAYRGLSTNPSLLNYTCFVVFFPHLIAGPIVQHSDILPQFRERATYLFNSDRFVLGLTFFFLGLAKKVIFADEFGSYADVGFLGAAKSHLSLYEAWGASLAYTLQLYFDFSGYSDMAIGLGLLFGIIMPTNFNSPYKARSIIDFWRRWHMTLSRFLREFIYIPLGGNRDGEFRRHVNLMATMLIGGLWHGAGWTFVIWGGLHGAMLVINHGYREIRGRLPAARGFAAPLESGAGWALTFLCVVAAWVVFRAPTMDVAKQVYLGMLGANGAFLPVDLISRAQFLQVLGDPIGRLAYFADGTSAGFIRMSFLIAIGVLTCFVAPNVASMSQRFRWVMIVLTIGLVVQKVFFSEQISPFLYFQF